jgi:hypothetical protein
MSESNSAKRQPAAIGEKEPNRSIDELLRPGGGGPLSPGFGDPLSPTFGASAPQTATPPGQQPVELVTGKLTISGLSVDLKEFARRGLNWLQARYGRR